MPTQFPPTRPPTPAPLACRAAYGAGGAIYLTSNAGFTDTSFQANAAPSGGAVGVGQSSSGIYFNGCTFNVGAACPVLPACWVLGRSAGCWGVGRGFGQDFDCTFNVGAACWVLERWTGGLTKGFTTGWESCQAVAGWRPARLPPLPAPMRDTLSCSRILLSTPAFLSAPAPRLQGNTAEVFGNDLYMESWVATPAYFNPFPTQAGARPMPVLAPGRGGGGGGGGRSPAPPCCCPLPAPACCMRRRQAGSARRPPAAHPLQATPARWNALRVQLAFHMPHSH